MLKNMKNFLFVGLMICSVGYAGYVLVDPPATASAAMCCANGLQCGPNQVCCRPDDCTFPCDPQNFKPGYCMSFCPPPC